jgi:hypothetical protein
MENFLKFLADPTVQIIGWTLGGIGWIFGIISGWLQIKSYSQQSKLEQGYIAILEQAQQDWRGKYTQEQIDSMTKELKRLEESINKDVPQKARHVFLEDQLSTLTENMAQGYNRYNEILGELKSSSEPLPEQIQYAIEQEIMPKYIEQQKQQKIILGFLGFLGIILLAFNFGYILESRSITLFYLSCTICWVVITHSFIQKPINSVLLKIGKKASLCLGLLLPLAIFAVPIFAPHFVQGFYDGSLFGFMAWPMIKCLFWGVAIVILSYSRKLYFEK